MEDLSLLSVKVLNNFVKLLRTFTDRSFSFEYHVSEVCRKAIPEPTYLGLQNTFLNT